MGKMLQNTIIFLLIPICIFCERKGCVWCGWIAVNICLPELFRLVFRNGTIVQILYSTGWNPEIQIYFGCQVQLAGNPTRYNSSESYYKEFQIKPQVDIGLSYFVRPQIALEASLDISIHMPELKVVTRVSLWISQLCIGPGFFFCSGFNFTWKTGT